MKTRLKEQIKDCVSVEDLLFGTVYVDTDGDVCMRLDSYDFVAVVLDGSNGISSAGTMVQPGCTKIDRIITNPVLVEE